MPGRCGTSDCRGGHGGSEAAAVRDVVSRGQGVRVVENVTLTPAGSKLVRRGDAAFQQARATVLPAIDADDMRAAIRVLAAMNDALDPSA